MVRREGSLCPPVSIFGCPTGMLKISILFPGRIGRKHHKMRINRLNVAPGSLVEPHGRNTPRLMEKTCRYPGRNTGMMQ